jgi:hypothetical protein
MAAYLEIAEFKLRTIMPHASIDRIENTLAPGWISAQLDASSRWVDMRLAKRYRVPFNLPAPEAVRSWVARMVTARAYLVHGIPASDQQLALVTSDADKAEAEVKEAADGQLGLIDLAPSETLDNAVRYGGTRVYSETSPYVQYDRQADVGRGEDRRRRGT